MPSGTESFTWVGTASKSTLRICFEIVSSALDIFPTVNKTIWKQLRTVYVLLIGECKTPKMHVEQKHAKSIKNGNYNVLDKTNTVYLLISE